MSGGVFDFIIVVVWRLIGLKGKMINIIWRFIITCYIYVSLEVSVLYVQNKNN